MQLTPYQGDYGVDLVITRDGQKTIVQCKHHPLSTIGEPVLRDLFGAMHHMGTNSAALVTTGQLTRAAREWLVGKPIQVWDAARLKAEWTTELTALSNQITQCVAPERATSVRARSRNMGWYVYTDNENNR